MSRRSLISQWLLGASILLGFGPVFGQNADPGKAVKPLRIGFVAPLTGASADFGRSATHGAELAAKEINQSGGYLGRPIELVVKDDKSDPAEGRRIAEALTGPGPDAVEFTVGYCNTGVALNSIEVFQAKQHLLMVPCATGTAVTRKIPPEQSYIFRVGAPDSDFAEFLAQDIVKRRGLTKVALFADTTGYGEGGLADFSAELAKYQIKPHSIHRFAPGVASLSAEMKAAKDAGADSVVVYAVGPEQAVAIKARNDMRWKVPYFAPWTLSFRSVLEKAGSEALDGAMMGQTIVHDTSNDRRMSFLLAYARHSQEKVIGSLMSAAQSYDAIHLMVLALFQSKGDSSGAALKKALENKERTYRGVVTTYEKPFTAKDHDAFSTNMIWMGVWQKGQIQFAYPDDAKRSSVVRRKEQ